MGHRPDEPFAIRGPLSKRARMYLMPAAPLLVLLVWSTLSFGGLVQKDFLPSPVDALKGLLQLFFTEGGQYDLLAYLPGEWLWKPPGLLEHIGWSAFRIAVAFGLSAAVALPLGILMGSFTPVEAFFDPILAPLRYMPITAFIPLLILWFGIFEQYKIAFLFLGTFVYLLPVVVNAIRTVPEELVQTALTLGASRGQVIRTVLIPHAMPEIFDSFRVMNAIAWTYVILAEVINARVGIGYMIETARTHHKPDWLFAGLLVIAVIGLGTDFIIRSAYGYLFRWKEAT